MALVYKLVSVSSVEAYAILDSSMDPNFIDSKNRSSLAQTFEDNGGQKFTVVVNHFKSKGWSCDDGSDPDTGDGQAGYMDNALANAYLTSQVVDAVMPHLPKGDSYA